MNLAKSLELMKKYTCCPECGNSYIANGEGKLIIEYDIFYRSCKCGWEITLNADSDMKQPESFGSFLKNIRRAKGLNSSELAERSGFAQSYISQIETGKRNAPPETIRKLSEVLGTMYIVMMIKAGYVTEEEILTYQTKSGFVSTPQFDGN